MTKREEIQEWARGFLQGTAHNGYYDGLELTMLEELDKLGVVIKVDRELPQEVWDTLGMTKNSDFKFGYRDAQQDMLNARYVATESLIEEE